MKLLAKIIIIVAIFFGGFYFGQQQALSPANGSGLEQEQIQGEIKVGLMFDFGNGEIQTYNKVALLENETVFDLLQKIISENDLEFTFKDYGDDLGALIESINNVASDAGADRFWHYWVNNIFAEVGVSNYQLEDGDIVEWKYTKNQFNLITN